MQVIWKADLDTISVDSDINAILWLLRIVPPNQRSLAQHIIFVHMFVGSDYMYVLIRHPKRILYMVRSITTYDRTENKYCYLQ